MPPDREDHLQMISPEAQRTGGPLSEAPLSNGHPEHLSTGAEESPLLPEHLSQPGVFLGTNGDHHPRKLAAIRDKVSTWKPQGKFWFIAAFSLVVVMGVGVWLTWAEKLLGSPAYNGPTWTVPREKLRVSIIERGTLESARNSDIICTVKSGTKGSTIATTIKWIIDPGVQVTKGDKLIELDSSGFVEQLKDQKIRVDQAKAIWVTADEQYRIQESQNESDIEVAKNALELARIDLEKYEKGEFLQTLEDVEGRIETARSDLAAWQVRVAWSSRMIARGYVSKSQVDNDKSREAAARIALQKVETERRVLVDFLRGRTVQDLTSKLAEARRALDRVRSQARAKLAQADADRLAKDSIYRQELSRKNEIEEEISKCTLYAPQDGLVVYYVADQARSGGQQTIVGQGEPVREGQKLMQIPDLSHMVVNVRVHEAMVSALRNEKDPRDSRTWQKAQIRIEAMPNRILSGHVKTVDTVAGQQDWFASDVKLYKTMVSIDEPVEGIKPGMSAEVTIYADESPTEVLVVPVQAIVGTISLGSTPQCFVIGPDGKPEARDIVVGMSNQRLVEVKSGLEEGDVVVLNPSPLVAERH